jgi:ankyrin repeat protein
MLFCLSFIKEWLSQKLIRAAQDGDFRMVKILVCGGADIHVDDNEVLYWSVINGYLDIVKYLTDKGADIHADNDYALRWGAYHGRLDIVKYLIECGADIHADSDSALRCSVFNGFPDVAEYLLSKGSNIRSALVCSIVMKGRLCEYFGWERIVEAFGAEEVYRDKYGVLLETENINDDKYPARFVRVTCPSTGRKYVLRVDPNVQTAKEAVASTFGLTEEQYCPILER